MNTHYDVIIIGGGPSGATAATILADHGHKVLVLERGKFPRHHIGESLMPNTYWTFKRLGVLDKMKASNFTVKESVQFVSPSGKDSAPFFFPDWDPAEWTYTWQVERARFDHMMLDNAREHGAEVTEQANVREVLFEGDRAVGVRAVIGGTAREIRSKVVVDASGQSGIISRQLKLRYGDEKLKNAAIYSYYKGALRDSGRNAGATLVIATPEPGGWFWFIPLSDGITSIGVVAPPNYLYNGRGDDPGAILDEEIANCPGMARRLENAERVAKIYTTADFSYRSKRCSGDGWILIGDAFGFLDPLYSSGVMLALKSGELGADAVHEALAAGDTSSAKLGTFGPAVAEGMQRIRMLVYAYYDPNFRMGAFVREFPQYKNHITRILIGDVFNDEVAEVFGVMKDRIALPESIALEAAGAGSAAAG
ncbi:MAG: NAD(P)/FAD-dependent oxidoreductase [Planctomycetota bacterium]|nr:MAG: NAD(P)/FAD-dependent oxidoreductase [Planctomycetota bacterium]